MWSEMSATGMIAGDVPKPAETVLHYLLTELVNNAIDHGGEYRGSDDHLVVRVRVRGEDLLVGFVGNFRAPLQRVGKRIIMKNSSRHL